MGQYYNCQNKLYLPFMQAHRNFSLDQLKRNYEMVNLLGKGGSGRVYAYRNKDTQQQYALKIIKSSNQVKRKEAHCQIQIMNQLQHSRIIRIFKYYDEIISHSGYETIFETGLLLEKGIGSLQHCMTDKDYHYDYQDIMKFIVKFIQLGAYLQSKKIVHRDIKPGNIIIFDKKLEFKLADFGLSCLAQKRPAGFAGTLIFCSPGLKKYHNNSNRLDMLDTNPYKDDVYSFAVTSQWVIKHRFKMQQSPKQIITLIQQMLTPNQNHRPTFRCLLNSKIVQEYLNKDTELEVPMLLTDYKSIELNQRPIDTYTKKRMGDKQYSQMNHHTSKSKKMKYQINYSHICKGIRTICRIDDLHILCGTDSGEIYVMNRQNRQAALLSIKHDYYVAKIVMDRKDNIWIAGGDGKVIMIERQRLLHCLKFNKEIEIISKPSLFSPSNQSVTKVYLTDSFIEVIDGNDEKYISEIYCEDEDHYIIGYCSGVIRVKWGKNEPIKIYQIHLSPITSLKLHQSLLYSCDFSGNIKIYSLNKRLIEKTVYRFNDQLIGFSVSTRQHGQNIEGITCKGQIKTINLHKSSRTTFNAQIPVKNIISLSFTDKAYYLLTTDGQIYFKNTFFTKIECKNNYQPNWICILQNEDQLIVASQQGDICIIILQN